MSRLTVRLSLGTLLLFAAVPAHAGHAANPGCDPIFRLRAESLDDLLRSAQNVWQQDALPASAYLSTVDWLFALEQRLYTEARAHHFEEITEVTYWQRSRLKFPSSIDQEQDALHLPR